MLNLGQYHDFFVQCDLGIWWMTLKNDTASLVWHIKLQCIISLPYVNSNWSYGQETANLGFDLCDLDLWPLTLIFCMDITLVNGNHSWEISWWYGDKKRWQEHCNKGVMDGRTDWSALRASWLQLKNMCIKWIDFCFFVLICHYLKFKHQFLAHLNFHLAHCLQQWTIVSPSMGPGAALAEFLT